MDKKIVLLVEDTGSVRAALKEAMEKDYNYEVLDFPDGAHATPKIDREKPHIDAAVLDIMMLGHGGTIADQLKRTSQYKEIPIIYHTSLTKEMFDNRLLEGAHYVKKAPDSIQQVGEILKKVLG